MTNKKLLLFAALLLIIGAISIFYKLKNQKIAGDNASKGLSLNTLIENKGKSEEAESTEKNPIQEVATNIEIPWEIAFLPNEDLLLTLRRGELLYISNKTQEKIPVQGVQHKGEGGLLGLALDQNYPENNFIYLYLTSNENGQVRNRVDRYLFSAKDPKLSNRTTILDNIPGANNHDGGRIAFGPDKYLYITTGDAQNSDLAQDTSSLAGKILRITSDGKIPTDNPFKNEVFSYGHRNPQGIDWDSQGNLWSSEHGRSIPTSGFDEVNLIVSGKNYGWPTIQGPESAENMVTPALQSGSDNTWAPGDLAIYNDTLFFTGLRGASLYSAKIDGEKLTNLKEHFKDEFGRIRFATVDPNKEWLYISTSNTDGRGKPKENDDKIIKILIESILD